MKMFGYHGGWILLIIQGNKLSWLKHCIFTSLKKKKNYYNNNTIK